MEDTIYKITRNNLDLTRDEVCDKNFSEVGFIRYDIFIGGPVRTQ